MNLQRKLVFLFLILIFHIRHRQRLRLRLQQRQEQRQYRIHRPQEPISYERMIFRLDTCGWNENDFREYLR